MIKIYIPEDFVKWATIWISKTISLTEQKLYERLSIIYFTRLKYVSKFSLLAAVFHFSAQLQFP